MAASPIALWILAVVAVLYFLQFARALLIPIALAVLISYALDPAVRWLVRHRLRRVFASATVLILVLIALVGGAYSLRHDARQLMEAVPKAVERARGELVSRLGLGSDVMQRATDALGNSEAASSESRDNEGALASSTPISGSLVERVASDLVAGMGHFVVIVFLTFFLLAAGTHVKRRIVEIAGAERRQITEQVLDDINGQIQRYLLVLLLTAVIVAVATSLVLAAMGTQQAVMWGLLAGVFNSIPYFGPVIVCAGLFVVGIVQGGGVSAAVQMAGAALVITSLEGWLITPPLMGKAERMNALAVFLGLLLWTWLWGGWGTVLAVPMLVIIKAVADHVDRLRPLGRLMAP